MITAVVLLSGGLDSAVLAHQWESSGERVLGLCFHYGQRNWIEVEYAGAFGWRFLSAFQIENLQKQFGSFRSGLLGGQDQPQLFEGRSVDEIKKDKEGYGQTVYVPFRNAIFLSFAVAWAETAGASRVGIGVKGGVGFDVSLDFVKAFGEMVRVGSRDGSRISVEAPLVGRSKDEIVKYALDHDFLDLCYSCYQGTSPPCGGCDTCVERRAAEDRVLR